MNTQELNLAIGEARMRVLFWCPAFWPEIGGVQSFAAALLPALRERGYEFAVITGSSEDTRNADNYEGVPIYRFPFHALRSYRDIDRLMTLKRDVSALKHAFSADLIHMNSVDLGLFFHLTTNALPRTPLLVTLHGIWPALDGTDNSLVERLLREADWVVGCSEGILSHGRQLFPGLNNHSSVVYNGVRLPAVEPAPLPLAQPRLLCLGRLSKEKRIDIAIRAFESVVRRFPAARLVIAGDGPERLALEQLVLRLELTNSVEFIGWVTPERVPELINTGMAVLMPSEHEAFPMVALESAMMGRPLIANRVGGLPEIVRHEETGLLVNSDAIGDLAAAVSSLLADPARAVRFGHAARHWVQNFSFARCVDNYDALYRKLILRKRNLCD